MFMVVYVVMHLYCHCSAERFQSERERRLARSFNHPADRVLNRCRGIRRLTYYWYNGTRISAPGCHQVEAVSTLLAICAGNTPVIGEFPSQRQVMRSFDVFFDLRLNKRFSKQSRGW